MKREAKEKKEAEEAAKKEVCVHFPSIVTSLNIPSDVYLSSLERGEGS